MEPRLILTGKVSQPPVPEIFAYRWPLTTGTGKWLPLTRLCGPRRTVPCLYHDMGSSSPHFQNSLHRWLFPWNSGSVKRGNDSLFLPCQSQLLFTSFLYYSYSMVKKPNPMSLWHLTTWVSIWASGSVIKANTLWFLSQNLRSILRSVTRALGTGEAAGWRKGRALFCS